MKLSIEINTQKCEVGLTKTDGKVRAVVDGREYDLEVCEPEKNVFLFKYNGRIDEVMVYEMAGGVYVVRSRDAEIKAVVTDPKRLRGSSIDAEHAGGAAEIKTAMPGKVVRILVAAGDDVQKGDGVLVVEAMKMQNEMKSPKDGVVKEIRTAEGSTVNAGDVLAVIE